MLEPSGVQWCERYPTSDRIEDLIDPFRSNFSQFLVALALAGAHHHIAATYRPEERAWLMHYACMIAGYKRSDGSFYSVHPREVPPVYKTIGIDWTHGGDEHAAREAARAMVAGYRIIYPAALVSRHSERRAVDMSVSWANVLHITDAHGIAHEIKDGPQNETNPQLAVVAATYGVVKHSHDKPHWSDDGR